jgi:hypothetical protein
MRSDLFAGLLALLAVVAACGPTGGGQPPFTSALGNTGERLEASGIAFTVTSVERKEELDRFFKAGEGQTFLVVNVTIENKRSYRMPYQPYHFTVSDGITTYTAGVTAGQRPLGSAELDPQKDVSGAVNFKVPQSANDLLLNYQPPGTTGSIQVRLAAQPAG